MNVVNENILNEFQKLYEHRYQIKTFLGKGAYGSTYRALDIHRDIDVCVKLFNDGEIPQGASRDWHITSKLKHPLIVDTFTVEPFHSVSLSKDCIAVISRFIEGKNLGQLLDKIQESEQHEFQSTQLLKAINRDLCESIQICHKEGFGHGDLHERNIIICKDKSNKLNLKTVLIDFDNATYKKKINDNDSETKRMESDIGAIKYIVGCVTVNYRWHDGIQKVLSTCQSARDIQIVLTIILSFLGHIDNDSKEYFDSDKFLIGLQMFLPIALGGESFAFEYKKFLKKVANDLDVRRAFDKAKDILLWDIENNPSYPSESCNIEIIKTEEINAIDDLFNE